MRAGLHRTNIGYGLLSWGKVSGVPFPSPMGVVTCKDLAVCIGCLNKVTVIYHECQRGNHGDVPLRHVGSRILC